MIMKRKIAVSLLILLLLISSPVPASAQLIPSVSGTYSITTAPAADSSRAITATPGQTIRIDATASGTYSGPALNDFPIKVTTYTYLYKSGEEKSSKTETISQTINLATGDIPATTGTTSITVPADAGPGTYLLKIIAALEVEYMGVKYTKNSPVEFYTVDVVAPAQSGQATVTPLPTPLPETTHYTIDSGNVRPGSDGNVSFLSGEVSGDVDGTSVTGSVDVNLTRTPSGADLNIHMAGTPDPTVESQFMLAAARDGSDITDIACVLVVDHPDLANGKDIASATITMKVSRAWAEARGGIGNIQIFRYSDGYAEALDTKYSGMDGDLMVFQAFSPHGLSRFALTAVAGLPLSAAEIAPQGARVGSTMIFGILGVLIISLVAVIGSVYMLRQRKAKKHQ